MSPRRARGHLGTHSITATGGVAANYAITEVSGTLSVSWAPLIVRADDQTKVYGVADPILTDTVTGLVYGDAPSVVGGITLSAATGVVATAGAHPIIASGGTAANYAITDVDGTLSVSPAPLSIRADDKSKVYGDAHPALTYTASGTLYYGDSYSVISGVTLTTATAAAASVGTHPIIAAGGMAANYAITDVNGTLTVKPAQVTTTTTLTPPAPAVTVLRVVLTLNKKHRVTQVLIVFSGPVDTAGAQAIRTYRLATASKKNSFDARNAHVITLKALT